MMTPIKRRVGSLIVSAALHATVVALLLIESNSRPVSGRKETDGAASRRPSPVIFVVPPASTALPGLRPADDKDEERSEKISGRPLLSLPGLTLNFHKVAARSNLLFPVIAPGLALEQFLPAASRLRPDSLSNPFDRSNPDSREAPPLSIGRAAAQAIVDKSWSRHERWLAFQNLVPMLARYHANDGDLPHLLQMYFEQNGLQPFVESGSPDAKLWAQLAVAADHVDFIGVISRYASTHSASRVTTGLLLVLDTLVQSNLDVLLTMLSLDPDADLQLTRRANTAAFDFFVETQRHYRLELAKRHLNSIDAVKNYFDAVRLAILDTIVRTTPGGYRSGDARYLMGEVYWRQGNTEAAIDQWRAITRNDSDTFAPFYSPIVSAIAASMDLASVRPAIDRALGAERSQWRSSSYDRLNQFGYRFDTF